MTIITAYTVLHPAMDAQRLVRKSHSIRHQSRKRIAHAFQAGDRRKLRGLIKSFFTHPMVKISALNKAGERQPSRDAWMAEAKRLDLFLPFSEPTNWWTEPKRRGGLRTICDLPRPLKAAHYMIADVISAQMEMPNFIYNTTGKGRDRLITALLEKLSCGHNHYRVYDVRNCFQSVNPDTLYNLPIPRRIIENALDIAKLILQRVATPGTELTGNLPTDIHNDDTTESGPAGLMQGSPASNLIFAFLLQTLPQPDCDSGFEFLFGDDLILVARNEATCNRVEQSLLQFFGQPRLGPLTLSRKHGGHNGFFDYLGYEFRYHSMTRQWTVELSQRNWERMARKRCSEIVALRAKNPHGIYVDWMKSVRTSLKGFPALSDPNNLLDQMRGIGPDEFELRRLCAGIRTNRPVTPKCP